MNEKFWDLKKSKQDSMINGSLKVFAGSGYRHASTDEIVTEASVSKGLLNPFFRASGKDHACPVPGHAAVSLSVFVP